MIVSRDQEDENQSIFILPTHNSFRATQLMIGEQCSYEHDLVTMSELHNSYRA